MAGKRSKEAIEPQLPDISDDFIRYAELNPEFDLMMSPRVEKLFLALAYDENGNELPLKKIIMNIELFRERIRAIIPQLKANKEWMNALAAVKGAGDSGNVAGIRGSAAFKTAKVLAVASRPDDFKAAPRTFYKTLQEVFTAPTEQLALKRSPETGKAWDLSQVIIDPEKINKTRLTSLGLEKYLPAKKRTSKLEKIQAYAKAIPEIKEILGDLEPVVMFETTPDERHTIKEFRLSRITSGKNKGFLLGTQEIRGKKIIFKTDLHGGYRRLKLIRQGHGDELKTLAEIEQKINEVDNLAKTNKPLNKEEAEHIEGTFRDLVAKLKFVTDEDKKRMLKKAEKCMSLKSMRHYPAKMGRLPDGSHGVVRPEKFIYVVNIPEKITVWVSIKDDLKKRRERIHGIRSRLAGDETKLENKIAEHQAPFKQFSDLVEQYENPRDPTRKGLHILRENEAIGAVQKDRMLLNLRLLKAQFDASGEDSPKFEPYATFASVMTGNVDETIERLKAYEAVDGPAGDLSEKEKADRLALANSFLKIYLVAKVEKFHVAFQAFYSRHLSGNNVPDFAKMLKDLEYLEGKMRSKKVKKDLVTGDYFQAYCEIYHMLNSLKKKCRDAMERCKTDIAIKKQFQEAKVRARNFRFDLLFQEKATGEKQDG